MSALRMLKTPGRTALFAFIAASIGFFCTPLFGGADAGPLYYIYRGEQKALTLDADHIAVRVTVTLPSSQSVAALPMSLVSRGFTEADVVARPVAGWMVLKARDIPTASSSANQLASPSVSAQAGASSIHTTITSMLNSGDPSIEFVSPVFRDGGGDPVVVTPTILIGFKPDVAGKGRANLRTSVSEGALLQKLEFPQPNNERWQIQSKDGFAVLNRANALATAPGVAYAEPDMIVTGHANLVPTDPGFGDSWGLNNTGKKRGQSLLLTQ